MDSDAGQVRGVFSAVFRNEQTGETTELETFPDGSAKVDGETVTFTWNADGVAKLEFPAPSG